jgi:maleate isomerase
MGLEADGSGPPHRQVRVGVLTPHAAAGPEVELPEMAPGRVAVVVARIRSGDTAAEHTPPSTASGLRALTVPSVLDRAAAPLRDGTVEAVAYASVSSSYVLGQVAEATLVDRLRQLCRVPVVASGSSAVRALRARGSHRVVLVHPPWFDDEVDELGVTYFRDQGFDVSLSKAGRLPNDPSRVQPQDVIDWVVRHVGDEADAVFLAGNGFRAAAAIEELERRTGLLVLESNQVLLWAILAAMPSSWEVTGYGRLFGGDATGAAGETRR